MGHATVADKEECHPLPCGTGDGASGHRDDKPRAMPHQVKSYEGMQTLAFNSYEYECRKCCDYKRL